MGPKSITNLFSYKCEEIDNHLWGMSSVLLCLPKASSNNMSDSNFVYDGANLWNSVPNDIRECKSISFFRNKIATHIFDQHYMIIYDQYCK